MKIKTRFLGDIDIDPSQIITFPEGIPAFEEEKQFVLLPMEENSFFFYLQAAQNADLCLILVDPFVFFPGYQVELGDEEQQKLDIQTESDVTLFAVVTLPDNFQEATANLLAPVIINMAQRSGLQSILLKSQYQIKHRLFLPPAEQQNVAAQAQEGK